MKVKRLKEILQNTLETLEDVDENTEIKMETNTYFMKGVRYFLSSAGEGYFDIENPIKDSNEEDE